MCTINDNHIMYSFWDIEHERHIFLSFWTIFCPFTLLTTQKIKILKNWKKMSGDIILHMCPINGSWYMECNRQIFLSFWAIFCPFTPLKTWKIKIFRKWKKLLEILFYTSVPKIMIICYSVPEIWCLMDVNIFSSELFFALLSA